MNSKPLAALDRTVSCIVPTYNSARFIEETLDSILAQTIAPFEVLVVDDGSTDNTVDVVARFGNRVRVLRQQNAGPSAARNNAVRETTGSYIAFLDSDDLWKPEKLARQFARFDERPELEICFTDLLNFRTPTAEAAFRDGWEEEKSWPRVQISPCTMLARRDAFLRVGDFDEKLRRAEDTEWFVRMMMRKIVYDTVQEELLWRRIHDRNLSLEAKPSPLDVVKVLKVALDRRRTEGW